MTDMFQRGDQTHLVFKIPSRGTMGLRTRLLNVSRGEATMFHHFSEYGAYRGEFGGRKNGSMIAMATEKSVAYALDTLQQRGSLFVGPGGSPSDTLPPVALYKNFSTSTAACNRYFSLSDNACISESIEK